MKDFNKYRKTKIQHTTIESASAILDSKSAAPARNAIFDRNNCANITIIVNPPIIPCFCFFLRP